MIQRFPLIFLLLLCFACKKADYHVAQVTSQQIEINDSIPQNDSINAFIEPYKNRIDEEMNAVLAYSAFNLNKTDGKYNTAIGNMMADAVMELASPIFESRTGNKIDAVLLNHGGIRSTINQGNITTRTAYQVMPFENEVVVAELDAEQMQELLQYLADNKTAHPIAGMRLQINEASEIIEAMVQQKSLSEYRHYFVATSDYLLNGGDNMNFFQNRKSETFVNYKLRNLLIDYFTKKDTIAPQRDQRFTSLAE